MHRAQEMAGTALYLASSAGCYTNGQEIVIDGGYLTVNPSTKWKLPPLLFSNELFSIDDIVVWITD